MEQGSTGQNSFLMIRVTPKFVADKSDLSLLRKVVRTASDVVAIEV